MKCLECKGACCETIHIDLRNAPPKTYEIPWLLLHCASAKGGRDGVFDQFEFNCRCTALSLEGICKIHETKPMICELFAAGSRECLETVKKRRTPEQYQLIREDGDPDGL
ncbi:MAG: YkgJ family cysteine cluster protein [Hyphomicrobiaceae bacterium]|nr:MAG: YkgJ family cysteine cluster protein [Hyphomicrobiaceae bacterium]